MGRAPCCDKVGLKRGPWQPEEDEKLIAYIREHGHDNWRALPQKAGLLRCGKSCRLRWTNYLRPDIKRGSFSIEEDHMIIQLHSILGNRWSVIAAHIPGRTDNEIKNYWNTHLRKQLAQMGIDPSTHRIKQQVPGSKGSVFNQMALWETARVQAESRLAREYLSFLNRKQPKNNSRDVKDEFFAEWLQEYFKSFGKYLNDSPVDQPLDRTVSMSMFGTGAEIDQPLDMTTNMFTPTFSSIFEQQQLQQNLSDCSFTSSDCSTLPQLREADVSFVGASLHSSVGLGSVDEYIVGGGVPRGDAVLNGPRLQDLSTVNSVSVPPSGDLEEFTSTSCIDGAEAAAATSPTFLLSPLDCSLDEDTTENLDVLELTTESESIPSNSEYWSTILRIVGN